MRRIVGTLADHQ